jgi:hypothetical protein
VNVGKGVPNATPLQSISHNDRASFYRHVHIHGNSACCPVVTTGKIKPTQGKRRKSKLMNTVAAKATTSGSRRTIVASLAALGSVVLASSCRLPMFPFIFAAGAAGSSAFFTKARPFLLAASLLSIAFAFYQRWRARRCQCKPNLLSTIILWFSVVVVLTFFLFPQLIANLVANSLAR